MIVIVDYGMGNLGSIENMLSRVGADAMISSKVQDIKKADKLILPGVGAFDNGMSNLDKNGFIEVLNELVIDKKKPILGICLGMQLFTKKSEEGVASGLGWIDADTVRFRFPEKLKNLRIPHMGWNTIHIKKENDLFRNMDEESRFYFVHSYHVVCKRHEDVLARTHYGYDFDSIIQKDNITGMQFHPEKSHRFGMQILKNFAEI